MSKFIKGGTFCRSNPFKNETGESEMRGEIYLKTANSTPLRIRLEIVDFRDL